MEEIITIVVYLMVSLLVLQVVWEYCPIGWLIKKLSEEEEDEDDNGDKDEVDCERINKKKKDKKNKNKEKKKKKKRKGKKKYFAEVFSFQGEEGYGCISFGINKK